MFTGLMLVTQLVQPLVIFILMSLSKTMRSMQSRINTVVVCALTSNLKRASAPGNVLLEPGEANLPKQSVVNISQIFTVDRSQLGDKIGMLSSNRLRQVIDGLQLLLDPYEFEEW